MRRAALLLVIAACGGPQVSEPTPVAGPKDCERMADHVVGAMQPKDEAGERSKTEIEVIDKLTNMLIKQCTDHKWSVDAQKCFLGIASIADADKCAPLLTPEQRDAADQAIDETLGPRNQSGPPPPASGIP